MTKQHGVRHVPKLIFLPQNLFLVQSAHLHEAGERQRIAYVAGEAFVGFCVFTIGCRTA